MSRTLDSFLSPLSILISNLYVPEPSPNSTEYLTHETDLLFLSSRDRPSLGGGETNVALNPSGSRSPFPSPLSSKHTHRQFFFFLPFLFSLSFLSLYLGPFLLAQERSPFPLPGRLQVAASTQTQAQLEGEREVETCSSIVKAEQVLVSSFSAFYIDRGDGGVECLSLRAFWLSREREAEGGSKGKEGRTWKRRVTSRGAFVRGCSLCIQARSRPFGRKIQPRIFFYLI